MFLVIPEQVANEDGRKIDAGEGGGPTEPTAPSRRTKPSIDESQLPTALMMFAVTSAKEMGRTMSCLHATPYCEIKQKGQRAQAIALE